jgi:hypothetical protein
MNFVTAQIKKAEQLLEQVDQTAEELALSSRTGGGVLKQLASAPTEEDFEVKWQQALQVLDKERAERERREAEFLARIRSLEAQTKDTAALEREVFALQHQVEEAKHQRDTGELQEMVEAARAEAQAARSAMAATVRDTSARLAELERTNLAMAMELGKTQQAPASPSQPTPPLPSRNVVVDERMVDLETRLTTALASLTSERARGDRLEAELGRALAQEAEIRALAERERVLREGDVQILRKEVEQAKAQALAALRGSEMYGEKAAEERMTSLSKHVEAKQRQIDVLRSEKSALEQRLQEALLVPQNRQVFAASSVGRRSVRLRPLTSNKELEKMLEAADSFTLSVGAVLGSVPVARLGVLVYLCFVHVLLVWMVGWSVLGEAGERRAVLRGS